MIISPSSLKWAANITLLRVHRPNSLVLIFVTLPFVLLMNWFLLLVGTGKVAEARANEATNRKGSTALQQECYKI